MKYDSFHNCLIVTPPHYTHYKTEGTRPLSSPFLFFVSALRRALRQGGRDAFLSAPPRSVSVSRFGI